MTLHRVALRMLFGFAIAIGLSFAVEPVANAGPGCCGKAARFADTNCCEFFQQALSEFSCSSFNGGCTSDYTCYGGSCWVP